MTDSPAPEISVIVPHLNDHARLRLCLEALSRQSIGQDRFEVVVGDNGSDPPANDVVADFPFARVVPQPEKGAGPARNAAVAASSAPVLAFTDADCIPHETWLEKGVAALEAQGQQAVIGGDVEVSAIDPARPRPVEAFELVFGFPIQDYIENKGFTVTANIITTRTIFDAVGPFIGHGQPEDVEWCQRAAAKGWPVRYVPEARVTHPAREDFEALLKKWRRIVTERYSTMRGSLVGKGKWLALTGVVALSPFVHMFKILTSPALPDMRARLDAIRILFTIRWWRVGRMIGILVRGA